MQRDCMCRIFSVKAIRVDTVIPVMLLFNLCQRKIFYRDAVLERLNILAEGVDFGWALKEKNRRRISMFMRATRFAKKASPH